MDFVSLKWSDSLTTGGNEDRRSGRKKTGSDEITSRFR